MWVGLPVQWVGGVYAYALTTLAPHDKSLDWNHLARGILISAEQQQYPDGQVDFLAVAIEGRHRVAAPFPVTIRDGKAHLEAQAGLKYQILVDGKVVDVASQGKDVVPF